jgi:hypothetical protein
VAIMELERCLEACTAPRMDELRKARNVAHAISQVGGSSD